MKDIIEETEAHLATLSPEEQAGMLAFIRVITSRREIWGLPPRGRAYLLDRLKRLFENLDGTKP